MSGAGEAAGAAGAGGAAAGAAQDQWYAGADPETTGWLQNRGWDKIDAKTAALNAVKSYREAEKHIGAPPDQLLRMPKDAADTENWGKLYTKLGVPDKAEGYDFKDVKATDGTELNTDLATRLRTIAHENKMTPAAAKAMASSYVKLMDEAKAGESAEYARTLENEKGTLRTNWGGNAASNMVIAQNAAAKLGVEPDALKTLEKTVGYSKVMDMFRKIGVTMGEDRFIGGGPGGNPNLGMSAQQAGAELETLMSDNAWVSKFENGDKSALQQFDNLTRLKSGYMG